MTESLLLIILLIAVAIAIVLLVMLLRRVAGPATQPESAEQARVLQELHGERDYGRGQSAEVNRLQGRLGALESELIGSAQRADRAELARVEQQQQLEAERIVARTATSSLVERDALLEQAARRTQALESKRAALRVTLSTLEREHAQATANLDHARRAQAETQAFVDDAQVKLTASFAALAGKVFDERGAVFEKNVRHATSQGKSDIETLLKPFADKLGEFRARVDTLYTDEARERSALLGAVSELKTLNQDMAGHTAALTRALKGSSKVRGDWGELMLESVLRGSGLQEGVHYERQAGVRDEDNRLKRPDVLVRLPDDRCVVVDSKVNLVAWQEAMNTLDDPDQHNAALQRHADGLRQHVKDLAERAYPKAVGENALDMTIAFVPIEGALSAALGADLSLQAFAFERNVVFTSPNTLMAMLRVVDRLWTRDKMQREAQAIGEAGGKVLDALMIFVEDFDRVGRKLDDAQKEFVTARGHLSESSQSVIRRAQRLAKLGAKGKKTLSVELKGDSSDLLLDNQSLTADSEDRETD